MSHHTEEPLSQCRKASFAHPESPFRTTEECLRHCGKGFPASPTHENTLTIKTVPPENTCGKALWTGHDPAIQICFMIFSCQNSLLPAMRNLRSDVTPSKRFFHLTATPTFLFRATTIIMLSAFTASFTTHRVHEIKPTCMAAARNAA